MAITATQQQDILRYTAAIFGVSAGGYMSTLANFVSARADQTTATHDLAVVLASTTAFQGLGFSYSSAATDSQFVTGFLANLLPSSITAANVTAAQNWMLGLMTNGQTRAQAVVTAVDAVAGVPSTDANWGAARLQLDNRTTVATTYTITNSGTSTDLAVLGATVSGVTDDAATIISGGAAAATGQTYTLTTGADTGADFTGTSGNDTFNGSDVAGPLSTWTTGDAIDGGAGTDIFNVVSSSAVTLPTGASVTNIETVNILSGADANVLDTTTGFSGLTALNVTGIENQTVTAASTTAISVSETLLDTGDTITVNGGSSVDVSSASAVAIASTATGGTITVGATTAAVGAVSVTSVSTTTGVIDARDATAGQINVTGGSTISVDSTITADAASNLVVLTGSDTVSNIGSDINITGDSSTTAVTVIQSATVAAVSSGTIGRIGNTGGDVDILDANRASLTAAGTITTVSITNAGATVVNSGALTTLNLAGTLTTVNAGTSGVLTTAANSALALNLTGAVSTGAVTIDTDFTTLNISGNTTASTINDLVQTAVTNINVSGDAMVTLTDFDATNITDIVVTNTGGAAFNTSTLAVGTNFTGGAGADSVILGAVTTAVTLGDGDDTVTSAGLVGTGGSVDAGAGTGDKIIMTSAQAATADNDSTFNGKFTNFEVLEISNTLAAGAVIDLDGINAASTVILAGGTGNITSSEISNIASGGTIQFNAGQTVLGLTTNVKSALAGTSDVLNINLIDDSTQDLNTQTIANVETINITMNDAVTAGSDAVTHVVGVLAANAATTINVSGNNGLTVSSAAGSVAVTTFDASGVVGNSTVASTFVAATTDSAVNLAVTYTSVNATADAAVTITGGEGNDVLTGSAAAVNVDTITGGEGADTITGGTGNDIIILTETTAAVDKVVFLGGAVTVANQLIANGLDAISGWGSTDEINVAALGDGGTVTGSTVITAAAAAGAMTAMNDKAAIISTDGTAANLTTSGTAVVTDWTDLTQVSAYLSERFTSGITDSAIIINDTTTGVDNTYVYTLQDNASATSIVAAEIALVGIIDNGGVDLATANVVFA